MLSKFSSLENPETKAHQSMRFDNSLKELRELRSQLHTAADYCESTFLKTTEKRDVLENTKEYICMAVVTVVDHFGNVSANLECLISQTNAFSDAELRINCLKQRLFSCEQYTDKLALTKVRWSENLPRFNSRYLSSPPDLEKSSDEKLRNSGDKTTSKTIDKHVMEKEKDLPKPKNSVPISAKVNGHNLSLVMPVRDGLSVLTKVPNPTFHFQATPKVGRLRRSLHGSDILSLLRRTKRTH